MCSKHRGRQQGDVDDSRLPSFFAFSHSVQGRDWLGQAWWEEQRCDVIGGNAIPGEQSGLEETFQGGVFSLSALLHLRHIRKWPWFGVGSALWGKEAMVRAATPFASMCAHDVGVFPPFIRPAPWWAALWRRQDNLSDSSSIRALIERRYIDHPRTDRMAFQHRSSSA